jgi:16S rRNA (cytosine967-C5)-methyltransferase
VTPQARLQAAIEILDLVIGAARAAGAPADRVIADWFKLRRFAGSGDRRAVRELVYGAIRACGEVPQSGRAAMLRLVEGVPALSTLFDGSRHGPQPMKLGETVAVGGIAPAWLSELLAASDIAGDEATALLGRAPLDLRINRLKADSAAIDLPVVGEPIGEGGLRVAAGSRVEQWDAYKQGLVEVQDAGSQLSCGAVGAQPGETVIDLCAGAGGKTLALAATMANRGRLIACDTDRARLARLAPRAERAGAAIIEQRLLNPGKELDSLADFAGHADAVLVDAPCSGTGTWRRNPEARWRLTPAQFERHVALQARLLDLAARLVRPGGRLIYVTCSLLAEGAGQFDAFLARHPQWRPMPPPIAAGRPRGQGIRLTPHHDGTDGFFIARSELA